MNASSSLVFLEPGFLFLLALVPVVLFVPRRVLDGVHGALRMLLLVLVVLALGRPVLVRPDLREHHVLVADLSGSVSPAGASLARELAARWASQEGETRAVVLLGDGGGRSATEVRRPGSSSALGEALRTASRDLPEGSRVSLTLLSDGRATDDDWRRPVAELLDRGVPVHVGRLPPVDSVAPCAIEVPHPLRVGFTGRLRVDLVGPDQDVAVRLLGPDGEWAATEAVLEGGSGSAWLEFEPASAGFVALRVEVEALDGIDARRDDDAMETVVAVQDPLRVLALGPPGADELDRLRSLLGPGFELRGLGAEGPDRADLAAVDLVLLDDVPAEAVAEDFQQRLAEAVQDQGLGLMMAGGRSSFGPGGWSDTVVEELLPVELLQKEEKRDPSTTLVVIIDTSGSMGGNRVQLAKEVARLCMRRLLPHDKVGIVEFFGSKRWAAPIQPASNAIELERALNRLQAGGGTVILPAIEEAFYGLQNVQTRYKHVLVLTDGGVESGAFEPLIRRMADEGINVSTVLIGPDAHSEFLVTIANWGKGRFYSVPNRFALPEILLKQPSTAKLPAWRPGPHPVRARGGAGWWGPVDPRHIPDLSAFVETRSRPGAEVLIEAVDGRDPVLASWRYGLGRVTALCTTPVGEGTASWQDWSDYGTWLARVLARTASDQRRPFDCSLRRDQDGVTLTAVRRVEAEVVPAGQWWTMEDEARRSLVFRERAPGHFQARVPAAADDECRARVGAETSLDRIALVSPAGAHLRAETQVGPGDSLDLEALAADSGGSVVELSRLSSFQPRAASTGGALGLYDLWAWAAGLAVLVYLADLLWRRSGGLARG